MNHERQHVPRPWRARDPGWMLYMKLCGVTVYPDDTTTPGAPMCETCERQKDRVNRGRAR